MSVKQDQASGSVGAVNSGTAVADKLPGEKFDDFLVAPCIFYKDDYEECRGQGNRRLQVYVHGVEADCQPWRMAYENCQKYTADKEENKAAGETIVAFENMIRQERQIALLKNNVWNLRADPPENWNPPIPESMMKYQKNSYFQMVEDSKTSGHSLAVKLEDIRLVKHSCSIS